VKSVSEIKKKIITIFGSSFTKPGEDEYEFAYQLGKKLGENGFDICNGGFYGTMEAAAKGAIESGSHTIGITVGDFNLKANKFIQEKIRCKNLFERITKLIELGDGYIILKGGTGTLLELSAVWEFINKNLISGKPVVAYKNFWKCLVYLMDKQMNHEGRQTGLIYLSDDVDEICNYFLTKLK